MDERNFNTISVERSGSECRLTLNRPQVRNALSAEMIAEITEVMDAIRDDRSIRTLIMRGAEGFFCAGGDIKVFKQAFQGDFSHDQVVADNRDIGRFLEDINTLPQVVVMLIEGAAIGGGFGLACVSDVAIATADTRFALSETSLGVIPAQIAAFVVQRIGFTQARRYMLTASRFKGDEAAKIGLVHEVVPDADALEAKAAEILGQIQRCAPQANASTKQVLHSTQADPLHETLDMAAGLFATAMQSEEGREGVSAFLEKRKPSWATAEENE